MSSEIPAVVFEDQHLLVVNKPAGLNTHAPSPYAGEGIYDWLRHREPRWAHLAIIHRLDKETSGVIVFGKTSLANRSLTQQFTARTVRKKYVLLTDRNLRQKKLQAKTTLVRAGDKYLARPVHSGGELAETHFRVMGRREEGCEDGGSGVQTIEAEPLTGRTHQIRAHAAHLGFPILGDTVYGGSAASRVYLHAQAITLRYPASNEEVTFETAPDFETDRRQALRQALIEPALSDACRLIHGASDDWAGCYVDQLGDFLLAQAEQLPDAARQEQLTRLMEARPSRGVYYKVATRGIGKVGPADACPRLFLGETAPDRFAIRENGIRFELSFREGYSVGLFLDQRDNRRRLLTGHVAAGFALPGVGVGNEGAAVRVLNTFAYTCGFSVCAARAGAQTTSLDLSKKYLEWGKRNFELNGINAADHDFIFGDAFDWLRRLDKKGRRFEIILLDPPTFSRSKEQGTFQVERDYGKLVVLALKLLEPGGVLFASTNAAEWAPEKFMATVTAAAGEAGRKIIQTHYVPQPLDFPVSRAEPAYLKTVWLRLD